jgi:EAL domain-containing protein (putative c-di-GMP-specific phosphodiesterase class I)
MIFLAHEFGIQVVAEGVEAQDHLDLLMTLNCDQHQGGNSFSRPVKVEDLAPSFLHFAPA